jgi:hypothetical protein
MLGGKKGFTKNQGSYYDPYAYDYDRGRNPRYDYQGRQERLAYKYDKAMRRLDREEQNTREKAYRTHRGDTSSRRFQRKMDKIDRKYAHKRGKVERNTAKDYRKMEERFDRRAGGWYW